MFEHQRINDFDRFDKHLESISRFNKVIIEYRKDTVCLNID